VILFISLAPFQGVDLMVRASAAAVAAELRRRCSAAQAGAAGCGPV
jgi:hypothetical protein